MIELDDPNSHDKRKNTIGYYNITKERTPSDMRYGYDKGRIETHFRSNGTRIDRNTCLLKLRKNGFSSGRSIEMKPDLVVFKQRTESIQ